MADRIRIAPGFFATRSDVGEGGEYVRADRYDALRAELAAARERADTLHAALDEAVSLLHGLEEPAWSGIGGSATVDRLSDVVERLAAPTSAAHTGEGGEHGPR